MAREPFKSGVMDYEALYKRVHDLGIHSPVGDKNGVTIPTEPAPDLVKPDPDCYRYF